MNRYVLCFGALWLVTSVQAQNNAMDFGVASEVVRNMMSAEVGQSISTSTNLMANYRNYALEQELAQEASRRGLTERIDVLRTLEDQRRDTLIMALRNDIVRTAEVPSEETIKKEYQKQKDRLVLPAAHKLDVFSVSAVQTQLIEKARALAANSSDIAEPLTKRGFIHVSAQLAEPWFTSNQVAGVIWDKISAMPKAGVDVFPDGDNVLLIRKIDSRTARVMTLEEAQGILRNALMRDRQEALWNEFVSKKSRELGF